MVFLRELVTGDRVYTYNKSVVVKFNGERGVLSTGILNGGYSENLQAVFNHDAKSSAGMGCKLKAPTYEEHMKIIAEELGLDFNKTSCIGTAADMENTAFVTERYEDISVTAMVTAGIESNGGRVGDPASFHECNDKIEEMKPGTINMIIMIDGNLPERTLTRALVTSTEAKTAAIQELIAGSNYSTGIATGSGTDGTIIYCNLDSKNYMTNAGKHSKLGELIGVAVKKAVKEALFLQTGLCPEFQKSVFRRFKRYGITIERVWNERNNKVDKLEFVDFMMKLEKGESIVSLTSLYIHLLDQNQWELLSPEVVLNHGKFLLEQIASEMNVELKFQELKKITRESTQKHLIEQYSKMLSMVDITEESHAKTIEYV